MNEHEHVFDVPVWLRDERAFELESVRLVQIGIARGWIKPAAGGRDDGNGDIPVSTTPGDKKSATVDL